MQHPLGKARPPTPFQWLAPRAWATPARRAYAQTGIGRKSAAKAGRIDGRLGASLCGEGKHLLHAAVRRVHIDAVLTAEPHAVAIALRVGQRHATTVHELPAVFSAGRRVIEQPDLPAKRRKV